MIGKSQGFIVMGRLTGSVGRRVSHRPRLPFVWALLGLVLGLAPVAAALAQAAGRAGNGIYSCTDARGRRLTSDRPIIECLDREQRVMNNDGSTRTTLPPSMTANERAAVEEAQRQKQAEENVRKDTIRHDRNLMARFPNEATHYKAREAALDNLRDALKVSERRLDELEQERRPLLVEAEFYKSKPKPPKLKSKLEYIEVAADAQRTLVVNQQAELVRLNANYDDELARLKKLWGGAPPGTVGPVPVAAAGGKRR